MSASDKTQYAELSQNLEHSGGVYPKTSDEKKINKKRLMYIWFAILLIFLAATVLLLENGTIRGKPKEPCQRRIVGYLDLIHDELEFTEKQIANLTHLIITPMEVDSDGSLSFRHYGEKDRFETIVSMARKFPDLKVIVSLADVIGNPAQVIRNFEAKAVLLNKTADFLAREDIDGIDINWKWPRTDEDYEYLTSFCEDLREKLTQMASSTDRKTHFSISALLPAHIPSTKVSKLMECLDFVTITTHNYYGSWQTNLPYLLGPASPLYSKLGKLPNENVDSSMKEYSCFTKQPNKLNILVEFMGRYWKHLEMPLNGEVRSDWIEWRKMANSEWDIKHASWNNDSKTPYIWNSYEKKYMAFENERSLEEKIKYAIEMNIGGLAVWRIDHDDSENTLLNVVSSAELCSGSYNTAVKYDC